MPRNRSIGQQLLDVPFPDMISSMGLAIAEAQFAMDEVGVRLAQMMSGEYEVEQADPEDPEKTQIVKRETYVTFDGRKLSLLELGFTPTFYQFVDTIIEVKVSISMSSERTFSRSQTTRSTAMAGGMIFGIGGAAMRSSTVSASYASKYQYSAEGASLIRTKLVPVPPPNVLEERIRAVLERKQAEESE